MYVRHDLHNVRPVQKTREEKIYKIHCAHVQYKRTKGDEKPDPKNLEWGTDNQSRKWILHIVQQQGWRQSGL